MRPCTATIMSTCSATASRPKGRVGLVDEPMTLGTPARSQHVGHVPAAATLDVEGVDGPAVQHGQGVVDRQALVEPVGVQGDLDVVLLGDPQRGVERAGVRADVLVHLEPADAGLEQAPRAAAPGARPSRGRGSRR